MRNLVNEAGIMSVRKGHSKIYQQDIIDVLDKQLLEGMGVLLTEEEQQKCEESVCSFLNAFMRHGSIIISNTYKQHEITKPFLGIHGLNYWSLLGRWTLHYRCLAISN